jgi:DNA-directed RNA polymerase subunit RPC12/RpoP
MKYNIKCKECGVKLTFKNVFTERDINNKTLGCCRDCGENLLLKLKQERLVEVYKNNSIYIYEGKYIPYWGCNYCFNTIEECRARIDIPNTAIVSKHMLGKIAHGEI